MTTKLTNRKRLAITLTQRQFDDLNKIVESGIWGNKPSSVVKDILISKLYTSEKTIEKALEKAGWKETYMKGSFGLSDKTQEQYILSRTFSRRISK